MYYIYGRTADNLYHISEGFTLSLCGLETINLVADGLTALCTDQVGGTCRLIFDDFSTSFTFELATVFESSLSDCPVTAYAFTANPGQLAIIDSVTGRLTINMAYYAGMVTFQVEAKTQYQRSAVHNF